MLLDDQRRRAAQYLVNNYEREQRYLIVYERDMEKYISAFSADNFKSAEKREGLKWDFAFDFLGLQERMAEFRWSKEFLADVGIDFKAAKKLFFSLLTAEEIAECKRLRAL